jgi:hypothetical protein
MYYIKRVSKISKEAFVNTGNIYVFYHIYCNDKTIGIVKDQLAKLIFSELYNRVTTIYCFLTGEPSEITVIKELIALYGSKCKLIAEGPGDTSYERFTLQKIHEFIKPEDKFLYIHSKGVTVKKNLPEAVYWWRTYMEYNLFTRVTECIEILNTHDIVGVAYSTHHIGPHFSGNFWWSTGKYYLSLNPVIGTDYYDPEAYIFTGNPKYKDIDDGRFSNIPAGKDLNLYENIIYPKLYLR